jgi:DNA-binding MarR family transcriptional regulator
MKKPLTYRQQQFLGKFLEIYREMGHPVHYIAIAERMGVGKVTAYEMLRLFEDRGFVQAEYQPNPDQHGPGRSVVLFYPTPEGEKIYESMAATSTQTEDWETTKEQILADLQKEKPEGYDRLMEDLLSRIPEDRSPLLYATELITTIVIMLVSYKEIPAVQAIIDRLGRIGLPQEIGLNVLSGISMFLSVWDRTNRKSSALLMSQINRFESVISQLSEGSKRKLSAFTRELIRILSI